MAELAALGVAFGLPLNDSRVVGHSKLLPHVLVIAVAELPHSQMAQHNDVSRL